MSFHQQPPYAAQGISAGSPGPVVTLTRPPVANDVVARREGARYTYAWLTHAVTETALPPVGAAPFRVTEPAPRPPPVVGATSGNLVEVIARLQAEATAPPASAAEERVELAGVLLLVVGVVGAIISTRLWLPLMATVGVVSVAVLGVRAWQLRAAEEAPPPTTPTLFYDLGDPVTQARAALAAAVPQALAEASMRWGVVDERHTYDRRRNAGANTLVRRVPLRVTAWSPAPLNVCTWALEVDEIRLAFWPDALLVVSRHATTAIPYDDLRVELEEELFAEEGPRPPDAVQRGSTWRYVCKDGTPDLRFSNNVQIPWLVYGELRIASTSGWAVTVEVSSLPCARRAADALRQLVSGAQQRVSAPPAPQSYVPPAPQSYVPPAPQSFAPPAPDWSAPGLPWTTPAAQPSSVPPPAALRPSSAPPMSIDRMMDTLVVLKAVAVADRRLSPEELDVAHASLRALCPAESAGQTPYGFEELLRSQSADVGPLYAAFRRLAAAPEPWRRELVACAHRIAGADSKLTPKERERLFEVEHNLLPGGR